MAKATPSDVFDLDALAADALAAPFRFRHGGQIFELPADPDVFAVGKFASGRNEQAMQDLLGDQWPAFLAIRQPFGLSRFKRLFLAYQTHLGLESDLGG
ncbi:MAG: hypothetical protein ABL864_14065 [Terricaulis sp.]